MKKLLSFVVLLLGMVFVFGCSKHGYTDNNKEFVIGCSGPLTGAAAIYGTAVNNSAKMAVEEINENGGLDGIKFKWVMTDDCHDTKKIANNYATMFEGGMQLCLGTVTSNPCLEFLNYAKDDNLFVLTPSATSDSITESYSRAYQMCFSDYNQGKYSAQYIKEHNPDAKIGVFYASDDPYSSGIYETFRKEYTREQQQNMVVTSFTKDSSTDFASQIQRLRNCDLIFMPIYYSEASIFMVQGKDKIADGAIYFGCDGFDGIEGMTGFDVNTIPQEVSYLSHFNANETQGKAGEFVSKYKAKYGAESLNQFGASAYDCVYALYNAMKFAKEHGKEIKVTISASDLSDILEEVFMNESFSFSGTTGENIKWNADRTVNKQAVKYIVKEKDN